MSLPLDIEKMILGYADRMEHDEIYTKYDTELKNTIKTRSKYYVKKTKYAEELCYDSFSAENTTVYKNQTVLMEYKNHDATQKNYCFLKTNIVYISYESDEDSFYADDEDL